MIELLVVVAIIGILAGILIPVVGGARTSANKGRTRVLFGQWGAAMDLFKQEYGYYPEVGSGNLLSTGDFLGATTGRSVTGGNSSNLKGNIRKIAFYTLSENDLSKNATGGVDGDSKLVDAFGNEKIAVYWDNTGNGVVTVSGQTLQKGNSQEGSLSAGVAPTGVGTTVRAGVIFYSAGKGTRATDYVYSWK